jgi:hypothetical protein
MIAAEPNESHRLESPSQRFRFIPVAVDPVPTSIAGESSCFPPSPSVDSTEENHR